MVVFTTTTTIHPPGIVLLFHYDRLETEIKKHDWQCFEQLLLDVWLSNAINKDVVHIYESS